MPDSKTGRMSSEELENVKRWMTRKGALQSCPICAVNEWSIGEVLTLAQGLIPGGPVQLGTGYPAVVLFCTNCAFMRWHNAYAVGVIPPATQTQLSVPQREEG
jgi:hypothetical protein